MLRSPGNTTLTNRITVLAAIVVVALAFLLYQSVHSRMQFTGIDSGSGAGQVALDGASRFHQAVSSGKSEKFCRSVDPSAFESITGFPCPQFIAYLHGKLGKAGRVRSAEPPLVRPTRVILDEITGYERGDASEHFEYSLGGSDPMLMEYRIQAEALNH